MTSTLSMKGFVEHMHHKRGRNTNIEFCNFYAYKLDEADGIGTALGVKVNEASQADYVLISELKKIVQIIEFTDLTETIKECREAEVIVGEEKESLAELFNKNKEAAKKIVMKKLWDDVVNEFQKKWLGSRFVMEKYSRKIGLEDDFKCRFLIVLRDGTDMKELQIVCDRLRGMMGEVPVCNSNNVGRLLLFKMPKPSILITSYQSNFTFLSNPYPLDNTNFVSIK